MVVLEVEGLDGELAGHLRPREGLRGDEKGGEAPPTTYAHIAHQKGREGLAVQYWF